MTPRLNTSLLALITVGNKTDMRSESKDLATTRLVESECCAMQHRVLALSGYACRHIHTVLALMPDAVLLEGKAYSFDPLRPSDFVDWEVDEGFWRR